MVDFEKITSISVCNMSGEPLYFVDGIDEETVSLVQRLNGQYDLEFDVSHRADETNISYETLQEGLYLYIEDIGFFKMRTPTETITPGKLTKHITAHSCDAELDDKNLNIEINMGTKTSQEYLVSYRNSEDEVLVNPLNGIPYDWIVLYNTFPEQLDAFKAWLQSEYTFNENGDAITVRVDDENYAVLHNMFELIPRLKSKLMEYVGHEDMENLMDVVTYEEVVDGESTSVSYLMQSYASYKSDIHGEADVDSAIRGYYDATRDTFYRDSAMTNEITGEIGSIYLDQTSNCLYRFSNSAYVLASSPITIRPSLLGRIDELKAYYQRYGKQLSLLDIVCSKTGGNWSVGKVWGLDLETPDYTLANTHYQFEINETIYSFLTATLAEKLESVVNFNIQNKTINVTPIDHIGEDTGVTLSYDGLLNQLDLTTDEDTLCTRLDVRGGNDITIEQVNFGDPYVVDIDYKLGVKNSAGQRVYVSDELAEKYGRYKLFREKYARPAYSEMSRTYNKINEDRNELIYRVPRDCVANDWGTFSDEELAEQLNAYQNLLRTLLQCYADDYGLPSGTNAYWTTYAGEETLEPWMSKSFFDTGSSQYYPAKAKIQTTMYWWDYYAYHQSIVQINVALAARQATNDTTGYSYKTLTDEQLREMIDAWETEWSLYGTKEIAAKISAYEESMQALVDGGSVIRKHMTYQDAATPGGFSMNPSAHNYCSEETYYRICQVLASGKLWLSLEESEKSLFIDSTWFESLRTAGISPYTTNSETIDIYTWDQLTDIERGFYGNIDLNYQYKEYKKIYDYRAEAQEALDDLQTQVDVMQTALDNIQAAREDMAVGLTLDEYSCWRLTPIAIDGLGTLDEQYLTQIMHCNDLLGTFTNARDTYHLINNETFTENEAKTIHLLYRDAEYTNENILTTSLNDTIDTVDILEELYQDACEQASIVSRPQINFEVDSDNIFAVEELGPFWEQFELGNYFYVEYKDGTFVKVRMVEYGYNPFIPSGGMTLKFSTMVRSKTKVTDLESVLGMSSSSQISSFGGGSSSSGQGDAYGANLNVAISDTMLGKLLGMGSGTTLSNALTSFMIEPSASAVRRISEALRREVDSFVNAATAAGFTLLAKQTAKAPVYQGLKDGATIVSADCLRGGMIESQEQYSVTGVFPYNFAVREDDAPISSDPNDLNRYMSADMYANAITIVKSSQTPPAWSSLSTFQKQQFNNSEDLYSAFIGADYINRTYNTPNSWFDMDNGMFSYAKGGLTYSPGSADEIGRMTLKGIVEATGGDIGGVKIGSASQTSLQSGAMYIGAKGMYQHMSSVSEFDLRPATAKDAQDSLNGIATKDAIYISFKRYAPSDKIVSVQSQLSSDGCTIQKNSIGSSYYVWMTGGKISLQNQIVLRCANSGTDTDAEAFTGLPNIPEMKITNGNIDCINAAAQGTGSWEHTSHTSGYVSVSGTSISGGSVTGHTSYTDTIVKKPATASGDVPSDLVNNSTSNRHIKIAANNSTYAALYSNGNIRATGLLRCEGAWAKTVALTGSDYAEFYEWLDQNVNDEDRRGRFVTLDGQFVRLANAADDDLLGIISATPTVTGAHDLGEWHDKYLRDEFGAILYQAVEIPDAYDTNGKLLAAAHTDLQPIINPDYDPKREYISRSSRPEWAVVGLVGQIIMLQDGSCYSNDYCKSADEGIATKSDERTNFRVMKRIDDRHILVMAK